MVNLDLSKMVPRGSLIWISAFIPGLFFEISIALGNPQLMTSHLATTQNLIRLSPYLQLAVALFLAFIIGLASMLAVSFIQHALTYLHSLRLILMPELRTLVLLPLLNQLVKLRFFASRGRFHDFRNRVSNDAAEPAQEALSTSKALQKLASKLFRDRYGVELQHAEEQREWQSLLWSVGSLTEVEWRGPLLMIASEATGWCGLVATMLAPALRNRYYIALSLIFLLTGLHNDYYVAGRRRDPVALASFKARAILREYEKDSRTMPESKEKLEPPETPLHPLA